MPGLLRLRTASAAVVAIALLGQSSVVWAQSQHQVLALHSMRRDAEVVTVDERELRRILAAGTAGSLDYYSEFIDRSRSTPAYENMFGEFLRQKYSAQTFDLVIAMDDGALDFVERYRRDIFPAAPVVFVSSRPVSQRPANSTGINAAINLRDTVWLAAALQPDLRQIFVVTGADRTYEKLARHELGPFEDRFAVTYLAAWDTSSLLKRLATLPDHSMVYYVHVTKDGANASFNALDYLDRVVAAANAPVYSWADSTMGRGILGGSLRSLNAQAQALGDVSLRVLSGEPADGIPITEPNLNNREVDWGQLQRWGIGEGRVPAGTAVRFREATAWEGYGVYFAGSAIVLVGQAALIGAMLLQRRRRKAAEREAIRSRDALRVSYERVRDLGARLLVAQEMERSKVARELHDDVSQQLVLLTLDLEMLGAVDAVKRAQTIARNVHDVSHRLHPAKLRLLGLAAAVRSLQRDFAHADTEVVFTQDEVPATLSGTLTVAMYRIAQEALQNAMRHSRAARVWVDLGCAHDRLMLTVTDDGVGFDVEAAWGQGLGLISMRERVQAAGGSFEVRSIPGSGTMICASVPLGDSATVRDGDPVATGWALTRS